MYLIQKNGTKDYITVSPWNTDIAELCKNRKWLACREKFGRRDHFLDEPMFIDTETSHISEFDGWIHQWAVCWAGQYITGRTVEQLIGFLANVSNYGKAKGKNYKILGYIHNLSYDMEYLRAFFPEQEPEFFAVKPHRILTAKWGNVEIRCSYLLTNKSLEVWGNDSAEKYGKLKDTYDYKRIITPEDPLTEQDWAYQLNDVATMSDAWHHDRQIDGYDTRNVPLTSTGFVREICRSASLEDYTWKPKLMGMQPDINIYNALLQAFSGGYTHGNRFYSEKTVRCKIGHRDFRSSYPARQLINSFPMGEFTKIELKTKDEISTLMQTHALLLHIALKDPELKNRNITAPYLSKSKCIPYGKITDYTDNGRVIKITGIVHLWITELDYFIIQQQYNAGMQVLESYASPKGKLPKWFRDTVMEFFEQKTTLKDSDHLHYMLAKALLNAIYGMTAQKPVHEKIVYDAGEWKELPLSDVDMETELNKYIKKYTTFLPYQFGVWTTAWARYALFDCIINCCGYDNFLYADTDSIFYISTPEIEKKFDDYNRRICGIAEEAGAFADYKGERYCLGEFTNEDDAPLQAFRFIHAKCYAEITNKGKLSVTVAGVTKKYRSNNKKTNADELKEIDNLASGFIFRECGGSRITYNNNPLHTITYNGVDIRCGASAVISDTEYKVNNKDFIDSEDFQLALLSGNYISDIYGDFYGIK